MIHGKLCRLALECHLQAMSLRSFGLDSCRGCWHDLHSASYDGVNQSMSSSSRPSKKEIRILIANDHPVVREGLWTILALQQDLKIVGQARDGEEACLLYDELSPDVLILDLRMPKKDGQEVVAELMSRNPRPRIIVLTNSSKAEDLRRALIAGAKGYLLKGAEPQQVWDTIRGVFAGRSSLPPHAPPHSDD